MLTFEKALPLVYHMQPCWDACTMTGPLEQPLGTISASCKIVSMGKAWPWLSRARSLQLILHAHQQKSIVCASSSAPAYSARALLPIAIHSQRSWEPGTRPPSSQLGSSMTFHWCRYVPCQAFLWLCCSQFQVVLPCCLPMPLVTEAPQHATRCLPDKLWEIPGTSRWTHCIIHSNPGLLSYACQGPTCDHNVCMPSTCPAE